MPFKRIYPILITIVISVGIFLVGQLIPEETIHSLIKNSGVLAPLIFILLTLLTFIFAPVTASPLLFAGYYAFGINVIFLALIPTILSYIINFWIARKWGRPLLEKLIGEKYTKKVDEFIQDYGIFSLLFLRIFQIGIHDFVSYAGGLTKLTFRTYFLISICGLIPGTLLWYYLARNLNSAMEFTLLGLIITYCFSAAHISLLFLFSKIKNYLPIFQKTEGLNPVLVPEEEI